MPMSTRPGLIPANSKTNSMEWAQMCPGNQNESFIKNL